MIQLAAIELVDIWAFVAMAFLWGGILVSAVALYVWLIRHDAEEADDFHLGL